MPAIELCSMSRIHKTYPYLLAHESPSSVLIDMAYRVNPDFNLTGSTLVVDYDLAKLKRMQPDKWMCGELEDVEGLFNRLLMQVFQYDSPYQVQRDILAASKLIVPTGEFRVSVPPKVGAKRVKSIADQCFQSVHAVKTKGESLLICRQPLPKDPLPEAHSITYHDPVSDKELKFYTIPGMFSSNNVDKGTDLLLQTVSLVKDSSVLDIGCGYGVIGVVAAMRGATVSLLDVDARAIKLARRNLQLNGHSGKVYLKIQPYDFVDNAFDVILSNPPTHAGSITLQQLFSEMVRVCRPAGYVAIVVREQLNYEKWLVKLGNVTILAKANGYKIIHIKKG